MNRLLFATCVVLWAAPPSITRAAVSERDWKVPGDGQLTFDDVNRREWLDIPESLLSQFSGTLNERIDSAIAELEPGGLFEGFTLAKSPDVIALAQSAGIDTGTLDFTTNQPPTAALVGLLGATINPGEGSVSTTGILDEHVEPPPSFCPCQGLSLFGVSPPTNAAGLRLFSFADFSNDFPEAYSQIGLMLYRQVPEPSTIALVYAFLISWSAVRCVNTRSRGG